MVASAISASLSFSATSLNRTFASFFSNRYPTTYMIWVLFYIQFTYFNFYFYCLQLVLFLNYFVIVHRNSSRSIVSALPSPYGDSSSGGNHNLVPFLNCMFLVGLSQFILKLNLLFNMVHLSYFAPNLDKAQIYLVGIFNDTCSWFWDCYMFNYAMLTCTFDFMYAILK